MKPTPRCAHGKPKGYCRTCIQLKLVELQISFRSQEREITRLHSMLESVWSLLPVPVAERLGITKLMTRCQRPGCGKAITAMARREAKRLEGIR